MVDSLIRLFESTATSFQTNGLGGLSEALKCEVVEERNGSFELEMEYHISGRRYSDLRPLQSGWRNGPWSGWQKSPGWIRRTFLRLLERV